MTGADGHPRGRPYLAVTIVLLASFLVVLDMAMVAVALPAVAADLGVDSGIEWMITAYLLALGVAQTMTGWLADRFGQKQVFLAATAGFGVVALLVTQAPTLPLLVGARVLQGLCGGLVIPLASSLAFGLFSEGRRGTAVGMTGTVVMLAPSIGPLLSGAVVTSWSWRWVLVIDVLAVAVAVAGFRAIPEVPHRRTRPFDGLGLVLVAGGLVAFLLASSEIDRWPTGAVVGLTAAGALLLIGFVRRTLRHRHPLIDLSVYRVPAFSISMAVIATVAVAQFARTVFIPLQLQDIRDMSPLAAGAVLTPAALASAVGMPIAGRWADRAGGRRPMTVGLAVIVLTALLLGNLRLDTPVWLVAAVLAVNGVGIVLTTMPAMLTGLGSVPAELVPQASALRSITREVAGAIGIALLATIIAAPTGTDLEGLGGDRSLLGAAQDAYNRGFLASCGLAVVGLLLARRLPRAAPRRVAVGAGHGPAAPAAPGTPERVD